MPFNALYNALGQLTSFTAVGTSPEFQWGHTYSYDNNANRTGGTITANGASMSFTSGLTNNRLTNAAGITVTTNAAGDITSLLGKTLAYDSAGQLAEATAVPPCPSGQNCAGQQTTLSRFNGWGQRYLRDTPNTQTVFTYGSDGFNLLSETTRNLGTSALSTTEHIYLPTASGPMPVATVVDGVHYAVHSDHLNTPRKLSDSAGQTQWRWPYSGFGEIGPQSTPASGQLAISYALRYPGQVDDGNGLFYNWHRFYDPRVGRYTQADPIGLKGGWNRFGYVDGNPLGFKDPTGLGPWDKLHGFPKAFWRWFHKDDPKLFNELKDPKTGQIPKEDAQPYYDTWKRDQDGFFDPRLGEVFLPWWFSPSPIYAPPCEMPGGPSCSPQTCPRHTY